MDRFSGATGASGEFVFYKNNAGVLEGYRAFIAGEIMFILKTRCTRRMVIHEEW
jgi:hypothetical protein